MSHLKVDLPEILTTLLAATVFASFSAQAQTQRSGGEAQKFMQQYQQVAAEKTALQAQVAQIKKDLDTAKNDLAAMKKERDLAKVHTGISPVAVAQATSARDSAVRELEQFKQSMTKLENRFRELANNLKEVEADRFKVRKDLVERDTAFDTCAENNMQLYAINGEILDRYEHVGLFTKVSAAEPFTRLTRTRLENLADQYRIHAQELRIKKRAPVPALTPVPTSATTPAPVPPPPPK